MDYESQHVHATSVDTNSYAMYAFNHFSKSRDRFRNNAETLICLGMFCFFVKSSVLKWKRISVDVAGK